jgi:hypothetical protein
MTTLAKDFTIKLKEDPPGTLASAFDAIARAGINIEGFAEIDRILHVLTQDSATRQALESAGLTDIREEDAVVAHVVDRPGMAANIFGQVADAKVDVTFAYVANNNRLLVGASNLAKVQEILAKQAAATA